MSKAWMPLYVADYLADTGHLDHEEHGVYLLAIMHYWQTSRPLPAYQANAQAIATANAQANKKQLQSICRCFASDKFDQIWSNVSQFFVLTPEGWVHPRIEQELAKASQLSEKRKEIGKKGGKTTQANAQAIAQANTQAKDKQLPTQSQSQSQYNKTSTTTRAREVIRAVLEEKNEDLLRLFPKLDIPVVGEKLINHYSNREPPADAWATTLKWYQNEFDRSNGNGRATGGTEKTGRKAGIAKANGAGTDFMS